MAALKMLSAFLLLLACASALVYQPEEGLRPPKRPAPPAPPTLPPNPYASALRSPPSPTGSILLSQPQQPLGRGGVSPLVPGPQLPELPQTRGDVPPEFHEEVRDKMGQFAVRFSNGKDTVADEKGHLISTDDGWEYVIAKEGSYSYISPEGTTITVTYVADENGFHPKVSFN